MTARTALVTGASSGVGLEVVRALAAAGIGVALAARRIDRLQAEAAAIVAAGGRAVAVEMDVTNETSVLRGYDLAEAALGPIDTVYANAGVTTTESALEMDVDAFDHIMAVNVRGAFLTAREGARRMIASGIGEQERGRIILVASIGGVTPLAGVSAYSTSKAAVVMMARSLAKDWTRKGINVNAICPGYMSTELNEDFLATEAGERMVQRMPRRRLMATSDLTDLMLYLGSDASRAVTGGVFVVDDGQTL
jgi:NAD(P)-dependent dehydrogenase (short-subunit alcohol dehydrogenase family)